MPPVPSRVVQVSGHLRLRTYEPGSADDAAAWPWYQDLRTVRLLDGEGAVPYSLEMVASMYRALMAQGEVFMIEQLDDAGAWRPIGDVTLAPDTLPILLRPESRGQGIGRSVMSTLIREARNHGWVEMRVRQIALGNHASYAMFESVGFRPHGSPPPAMVLTLHA